MNEQLGTRNGFEEPAPREWTPWDIWQIVVKRRWMVANFVFAAVVIAALLAFMLTPMYRATCRISIERKGAKILDTDVMAVETGSQGYESFYNTQYAILKNQAVIDRAVEKLKLEDRPRFAKDGEFFKPSFVWSLKKDIVALIASKNEKKEFNATKFYRRWIAGHLTVSPERNTQLVDIHVDAVEPAIAAEIANAIAEAYIDFSLEKKLDIARQSEVFISERSFELRKEIAKEERTLQAYARNHGIVTGDDRDQARQHLASLQEGFTAALGEIAARKAAYESALTADPASLNEVRSDPLVAELNRGIARKEEKYNAELQTYGTAYPELQKTQQAIADMQESLRQHTARLAKQVVQSRYEAYKESQARMDELTPLVEEGRQRVDELEQAMIEYEQLSFGLDRKKATLQSLLSRRNDMLLAASMGEDTAHNVRIINRAEAPDSIHSPNKKRMLALGLLLGLMLGVGCAVLLETLDDTLKTAEDVSQALDLLVVGEIPDVANETGGKSRTSRRRRAKRVEKVMSPKSPKNPALVTVNSPRGAAAEAYRELRTAVLTLQGGEALRSMFITSAEPGEGKTTTAINLAAALGQLGRSVLLIDTDFRRPNCHRTLRLKTEQGIVNYLKLDATLPALLRQTPLKKVWLLPAGPVPPDPAELLDSPRFVELVREVETLRCPETREPFDHVIFDTPPVLSVVDPILVGRHVDAGMLVLRSGAIRRKSAQAARLKLRVGRAQLLGAVLNALQLEDGRYGYRYYYYYSTHGDSGEKETPQRPKLEAHPGGKA